jgi:hypothetical protein
VTSDLLPGHVATALEDAQAEVRRLLVEQLSLRELVALSDALRLAGIGELIMTGRAAPLHRRLHQSARAFAHGLAKLPEDGRWASRLRPFFDAVAADDLDAAAQIARLARPTWAKGKEYPEDFYFPHVLMLRFFRAPEADSQKLLAEWKEALAGTKDSRLDVVGALVHVDAKAFAKALSRYLSERARALKKRAAHESVPSGLLATEWQFSVEGVALAKLARAAGLPIAAEYRHVPAVALAAAEEDWAQSDWRTVGEAAPAR